MSARADFLLYLDGLFARFAGRPALRREVLGGDSTELTQRRAVRIGEAAAALRAAGVTLRACVSRCSARTTEVGDRAARCAARGRDGRALDTELGVAEPARVVRSRAAAARATSNAHRERAARRRPAFESCLSTTRPIEPDRARARASCNRRHRARHWMSERHHRRAQGRRDSLATEICCISCARSNAAMGQQGRERFLSVLPLCHLFEPLCGLLIPLSRGASISYPAAETLRSRGARTDHEVVGGSRRRRCSAALSRAAARYRWAAGRVLRAARLVAAIAGAIAAGIPIPAVRRACFTCRYCAERRSTGR